MLDDLRLAADGADMDRAVGGRGGVCGDAVVSSVAFSPSDPDNGTVKVVSGGVDGVGPRVAPWIGGVVLFLRVVAEVKTWGDRRLLDRQTGVDSLRALSGQEFEQLVGEAYRRQGYAVEHAGSAGPDGGVDLRCGGGARRCWCRCKHWKTDTVGVTLVRELNGLIADERATAGIQICLPIRVRNPLQRDSAKRS